MFDLKNVKIPQKVPTGSTLHCHHAKFDTDNSHTVQEKGSFAMSRSYTDHYNLHIFSHHNIYKKSNKKIPLTPLHFSKQKKLLRLGEEITSIPDKKQTLLSFQFKVNPSTNACLHTQLTKATKLLLTECLTDAGLQKEGKCSGSSSSLVV